MPLPSSGNLSFSQIATITKGSNTAQMSFDDAYSRLLAGVPTGQISLQDFRGKPAAGSNTYTIPGNYSFLVPVYGTLVANTKGAGGGGGGGGMYLISGGGNGGTGGNSYFGAVYTTTTTPLYSFLPDGPKVTTTVLNSTKTAGYGGTGGLGGSGYAQFQGNGTAGGGIGGTVYVGGGATGGNGGGPGGGNGGNGGFSSASWDHIASLSYPVWASTLTITVGQGGAGGGPGGYAASGGYTGSNGTVIVSWG